MYEKNVYLLDLCIFAYQLHAQTLIWPMDPYYEQLVKQTSTKKVLGRNKDSDYRRKFMRLVQDKFKSTYTDEVPSGFPPLPTHIYRGPGSVKKTEWGWENNGLLDPIISDYRQIYPWRPGFTRPTRRKEPWIVYNTPKAITDRIEEVYMVRYSEKDGPHSSFYNPKPRSPKLVGLTNPLYSKRPPSMQSQTIATDWLYCFEGGTGAIADERQTYSAWSMMGFVLVERFLTGGNLDYYNLHIIFRGSRSGNPRYKKALSINGNPDWVTDLDSTGVGGQVSDPDISSKGEVNRGFRTSIRTMLPLIMECLETIQTRIKLETGSKNDQPRNIYVSGHSLGGGLATLFTSAVSLGKYKNTAINTKMPASIHQWPWNKMELVIFGAPTAGNLFFSSGFDKQIKTASRVYITVDVVAKGIYHVGKDEGMATDLGLLDFAKAHSPDYIRRYLIQKIRKSNSLLDVPAPTGVQEQNEPWKTFDSVGGMLGHLEGRGYNLQNCLDRLALQVITYLELLEELYLIASRKNNDYIQARQDLKDIIAYIKTNNNDLQLGQTLQILKRQQPANIKDLLGDDMYNFVGICIILAHVSKNGILGNIASWGNNDQDVKEFLSRI